MLGKERSIFSVRIIKMLFQCTLHNSGLNNDVKLTVRVNIVERGEAAVIIWTTSGMSADILTCDSNTTVSSKEKTISEYDLAPSRASQHCQ